jgi:hypothetical protein
MIAMAAKWNTETISSWEEKDEDACGNLIKKAGLALKKAEDRQADEARLRKMEASRDKLVTLVETVQDESKEREIRNSSLIQVKKWCTTRAM